MFVCAHTHRPEPPFPSALLSGLLITLPRWPSLSPPVTPLSSLPLVLCITPLPRPAPCLLLCRLLKEASLLPSLPVAVVSLPSEDSPYRGAASSLTSTLPTALPSLGPGLAWPQEPQHLLDWMFFTRLSPACKTSPCLCPIPTCRPTPIYSR